MVSIPWYPVIVHMFCRSDLWGQFLHIYPTRDIKGYSSKDKYLEVTDTGNAPGLCNSSGHEGIDLYFGEGKDAFNAWKNFVSRDSEQEVRGNVWWPVYRILK